MRVRVSQEEVEGFRARWPCSGLPRLPITFEFDATGALVDMDPYTIDGPAVVALSLDAQHGRIGTQVQ